MHSFASSAIVLVGFMGAGKTSVGQELARHLQWRFLDLDDLIQRREARSIPQIFRDSGEAEFRRIETDTLRELLQSSSVSEGLVAALGGGAFAQPRNRELLRQSRFPTVFLDAPVAELRQRCAAEGSARPLFQDENQFRQLYEARREAYMKADFRVDTAAKSVAQVATEVRTLLGLDRK